MELVLPVLALGGLYKVAQQQNKKETFDNANANKQRARNELIPNLDIPNHNYPEEYPVLNPEADLTSKLSTLNVFDAPSVYTDKYFNANMLAAQSANPMGPSVATYRSLTGESVGADYFQHNNMVPFFGSKSHANNAPNATESTLDNYVGSGSQYITKTERSPMFSPDENYQWAYGMPSSADFVQSRMNPSMNMANVRPFEPVQVGPGLGLGRRLRRVQFRHVGPRPVARKDGGRIARGEQAKGVGSGHAGLRGSGDQPRDPIGGGQGHWSVGATRPGPHL